MRPSACSPFAMSQAYQPKSAPYFVRQACSASRPDSYPYGLAEIQCALFDPVTNSLFYPSTSSVLVAIKIVESKNRLRTTFNFCVFENSVGLS